MDDLNEEVPNIGSLDKIFGFFAGCAVGGTCTFVSDGILSALTTNNLKAVIAAKAIASTALGVAAGVKAYQSSSKTAAKLEMFPPLS